MERIVFEVRGSTVLKCILKKCSLKYGLGSSGTESVPVAGLYVDGSGNSDSIIVCVTEQLLASQGLWSVGFVNKGGIWW